MSDRARQKWQKGLGEFLEPGERIEAAVRGVRAKFWQIVLIFGYVMVAALKRYRTYVVTDRNVYVFQASALSKYKVAQTLLKLPLGSARVRMDGAYLSVDDDHASFISFWGPPKRQALEVVEAATRSSAPADTRSRDQAIAVQDR